MESKIQTASQNLTPASLIWYMADFLNTDCNKVAPYTVKHIYGLLKEKEGENGRYTQLLKQKCEARIKTKEVAEKNSEDKKNAGDKSSKSKSEYPMLKDMDGKSFGIDDFKGKVVYIDFWASWCGPCRNEMPASKQLHEMFTEKQLKDIVFLYISIDASEEAWKNAVKELGIEGKLGISPGNWNSEITRYFQIYSIPHYMLMDKKGKIVDTDAKRPSSGSLIYNDIMKLMTE
jgi:thiol-disulfide isomerase/thioredoxin